MKTWKDETHEHTQEGGETFSVRRNFQREEEERNHAILRKQVQDFKDTMKLVSITIVTIFFLSFILAQL
ncbi:MAG: hypothetical protein IPP74_15835 [Alphaproteobacteria bacterium]|nr:hypothetical protein [Alphaproteobacteria bacterium]